MKRLLLLLPLCFVFAGCAPKEDPLNQTSNPASETPAEYRLRIQNSNMPEEEKAKKLEEIDRMKQMNDQMLKQGPPAGAPTRPATPGTGN